MFVCILSLVGCVNSAEVEQIIDVNQFSRITPEELLSIMGEAEEVESWDYVINENKSYPATSYYYQNNRFVFLVIDNAVVRLTVNSDKYNDRQAEGIAFGNEKDLFDIFNIAITERTKKVADTGDALRCSPVSDKVADLWVIGINKGKFDTAIITYNLKYFD